MANHFALTTAFPRSVSFVAMAAVTLASPLHAQNSLLSNGGAHAGSERSEAMKGVCTSDKLAAAYAGYLMGYNVFDTGGGERISIEKENALAQEIVKSAEVTDWSFQGWRGGEMGGQCNMNFAMKLAPEHAAHFNNDPLWGGGVVAQLANENGEWKVVSFQDSGAKSAVSGWLAAWRKERDRMPGGAPRLPAPLSQAQQDIKIRNARACSSHWEVSDDLFPAYNAWLTTVGPILNNLKIGSNGSLSNGRLVSSSGNEVICRYDIGTGTFGGGVNRSIHDIDMRFTLNGGIPKWDVASFPNTSMAMFSKEQSQHLIGSIYVGDKSLREWDASRSKTQTEAKPRNVIEAMGQRQGQYNRAAEAELRAQGIDVDAFKRAEAEETRKYAPACRKRGGTWGKPLDKHGNSGRLRCYFPTGER